ncbi:MAG: hypothetical protein MO846_02540 [Candidatus Devosia symbiotica]|nr:hypothetical protein [Candidatus Devosia symbiotica]
MSRQIAAVALDDIHIAIEGPLGLLAQQFCIDWRLGFTTSFYTYFPENVALRMPVPQQWSYGYLRWFRTAAACTLVQTPSLRDDLTERSFTRLGLWSRGVDDARFRPNSKTQFKNLPGLHLLYVGHLAAEKNVEAFLNLNVAGTRIVVGDGPDCLPADAQTSGCGVPGVSSWRGTE